MLAYSAAAWRAPPLELGPPAVLNVRDVNIGREDVDIEMVSLVLTRALVSAARTLDVHLAPAELAAGSAADGLLDPARATSRHSFVALLQAASERLQDPTVGVRLASLIGSHHLHFIGPLIMSSTTLQQALRRFQLVRRLVLGGPAWQLVVSKQEVCFGHLSGAGQGAWLEAQFMATLMYRLASEFLASSRPDELEIHFTVRAPADEAAIRAALPVTVRFGRALNGIACPRASLTRVRAGSNAQFANAYERFARERFLVAREPTPWAERVRQVLRVADCPARVELRALAASWNLSERTLRARLEEEGIGYAALREDVCMELAALQLTRGVPPVVSAKGLGYCEGTSFRRVFKRHHGVPPRKYFACARRRLGQQLPRECNQ